MLQKSFGECLTSSQGQPRVRRRSPQTYLQQGTRPPLTQQLPGAVQVPPACPGGQGEPRAQRRAPGPQQPQQPLPTAAQPQGRRHLAPTPRPRRGCPADCLSWNNLARPQCRGAASPSPRVPPASPAAVGLAASIAPCSGQCDLTDTRAQLAVHPRGAAASPLAPADCQPAGRAAASPSRPPRLGSVPAAGACPALRRRPRARQRSPEQGPRVGLAMAAAGGDAAQVTRAGGRRGSATAPRAPRHRGGWGCSWTLLISRQLRSC